ncbi:MAG: hypothetical protein K1W16_10995 [Lachnospiraceae bacterium]
MRNKKALFNTREGADMNLKKIIFRAGFVAVVFFVLTFTIYFFNLDMKMAEKIMPMISKQYDKVKKEKRL